MIDFKYTTSVVVAGGPCRWSRIEGGRRAELEEKKISHNRSVHNTGHHCRHQDKKEARIMN